MKKIVCILLALMMVLCLCACGNENWGIGNYTFTHVHLSNGVEGYCAEVTSWHDNELGLSYIPKNSVIFIVPKAPIFYMNLVRNVLSVRESNK